MSESRHYWLSFCDPERPKGQHFLGVCIVEVDDLDAEHQKAIIDVKFPQHQDGAEWVAAATAKAWAMGCNPGGEVMSLHLTGAPLPPDVPLYRLMQQAELTERGLA